MHIIPLQVEIGVKPDGTHGYPEFNSLQIVRSSGMDWCKYVDTIGDGWYYDKVSGHYDIDIKSPKRGVWIGVLLVDEKFAEQAIISFPDNCSILDEKEFIDFHDNRATVHLPDEVINDSKINAITAKQKAGISLTPSDLDALNPLTSTPGISPNTLKSWDKVKVGKNLVINNTTTTKLKNIHTNSKKSLVK